MTRYAHLGIIDYQPPYNWNWMMNFLTRRAVSNVETTADGAYTRSYAAAGNRKLGCFRVEPDPGHARVIIRATPNLVDARGDILCSVKRMFDLDASPDIIAATLASLNHTNPGLRLPGSLDPFEFAVRAILEQQISTRAAVRLTARFVDRFGTPFDGSEPGLDRIFPDAPTLARMTEAELQSVGITRQRANALHTLAQKVASGEFDITSPNDTEAGIRALTTQPGIGRWTAGYIAIRGWSACDVFLETDHAIGQYFPNEKPRDILDRAEAWRPYRSYAMLQIWEC